MLEAVIVDWHDAERAGTARSTDGQEYPLRYHDGQSFYTSDQRSIPALTGRHDQSAGGELKMPEVGDPVLIQLPTSQHGRCHWGYMRHYLELVERRYGTRFVSATDQS